MLGCVLLSTHPEGHVVFIFIQKITPSRSLISEELQRSEKNNNKSLSLKALYATHKATHKGQDEIPYLRFTL